MGFGAPPLGLADEHPVELGKLGRLVSDGMDKRLSLVSSERDWDGPRTQSSRDLARDEPITGPLESRNEFRHVSGLYGYASHIDVAPRHVKWVSRSAARQMPASRAGV